MAKTTGPVGLTAPQRRRLARIERDRPESRITGWSDEYRGPILTHLSGSSHAIDPGGNLRSLSSEPSAA
jgi:hypothetical protein